MSEQNPHSPQNPNTPKPGKAPARKLTCEEWEALLVDFLDGALPASETESFESHRQTCAACAEMFAQAGQGREWLNFLRMDPPVPSVLVTKILAQTSGLTAAPGAQPVLEGQVAPVYPIASSATPVLPFWKRGGVLAATQRVAQPRLLMTAAMAFFSITLTLNIAGVRLSAVHMADLKPTAISSNLDKQYHMASSRVVRYYDNLRFVYEMEAKVRELRHDADLNESAPADQQPQTTPSATPQDGNHKSGGKSEGPSAQQPAAMPWGEKVEAALRDPSAERESTVLEVYRMSSNTQAEDVDSRTADQAERGIA
jgi:hypothetical protein